MGFINKTKKINKQKLRDGRALETMRLISIRAHPFFQYQGRPRYWIERALVVSRTNKVASVS